MPISPLVISVIAIISLGLFGFDRPFMIVATIVYLLLTGADSAQPLNKFQMAFSTATFCLLFRYLFWPPIS